MAQQYVQRGAVSRKREAPVARGLSQLLPGDDRAGRCVQRQHLSGLTCEGIKPLSVGMSREIVDGRRQVQQRCDLAPGRIEHRNGIARRVDGVQTAAARIDRQATGGLLDRDGVHYLTIEGADHRYHARCVMAHVNEGAVGACRHGAGGMADAGRQLDDRDDAQAGGVAEVDHGQCVAGRVDKIGIRSGRGGAARGGRRRRRLAGCVGPVVYYRRAAGPGIGDDGLKILPALLVIAERALNKAVARYGAAGESGRTTVDRTAGTLAAVA